MVGLHHARRYVSEGEQVIVDGEDGVVIGAAEDAVLSEYRERQETRRRYLDGLLKLKGALQRTVVDPDYVALVLA